MLSALMSDNKKTIVEKNQLLNQHLANNKNKINREYLLCLEFVLNLHYFHLIVWWLYGLNRK